MVNVSNIICKVKVRLRNSTPVSLNFMQVGTFPVLLSFIVDWYCGWSKRDNFNTLKKVLFQIYNFIICSY